MPARKFSLVILFFFYKTNEVTYCRYGVSHGVYMLHIGLADYIVHTPIDRVPWAFDIFAAHLSKMKQAFSNYSNLKTGEISL